METENTTLPQPTCEGLEAFLASGFTKGIGKVYAKKIVDAFGNNLLCPDFDWESSLKEIQGLGASKAKEFIDSLEKIKVPKEILALLFSAGLKETDVEKIINHYGKRLDKILSWDPYDMVENVWKLSFFTADKIGKYLNIESDDPRRIRGAILTAIKIYAEEGNMFATKSQTLKTASRITGMPEEKIIPQLEYLKTEGRIVESLDGFYLPVYYKAEEEAARKLMELISQEKEKEIDYIIPDRDISGNLLSEAQRQAISTVTKNNVTIITGGPGTGKTTTVKGIISLFMGLGKKVIMVAPTGRAAKRMSELTGEEAKTIHRLLGYSMDKGYRNKHFDADLLIIDEASMLEQVLFNHLLQALKKDVKVVLVGDTDQLPAIGAGNVLQDMIDSGTIPVINLRENFRQKEGSAIAGNAASIKEGELPVKEPNEEFIIIEEENYKKLHDRLISLVGEEVPSYTGLDPKDLQVVTPQQEGPLGAKKLNIELQEKLNPTAPELKRGLKRFRLGDRVMQTTNSSTRGIYNGETGWVSSIDPESKNLTVTFRDGKTSKYDVKELKELSLAYATTVHKLQGSETDYMIMLVTTAHKPMLYRNLIYTGVSRAKKLCVILGEEKALKTAVTTKDKGIRNSNFKARLQKPKNLLTGSQTFD